MIRLFFTWQVPSSGFSNTSIKFGTCQVSTNLASNKLSQTKTEPAVRLNFTAINNCGITVNKPLIEQ